MFNSFTLQKIILSSKPPRGNFSLMPHQMSLVVRKPVFGVSDTNQALQPQKMARGLKFLIKEVEESYYPCSENKGADQLRNYNNQL